MAASLLIAFDGSAAAEAAVRAAAALFPGARATVLTIHAPVVGPVTAFRAGGGLMSPELVEQNVAELERELVAEAEAAAAEGARLAETAGLVAEPVVAPASASRGSRSWPPRPSAGRTWWCAGAAGAAQWPGRCSARPPRACCIMRERAVLIVPEAETPPDGPALIAYDGSPAAREAIAAVGRLLPGRAALVVHAWESALRHSLSGRALSRRSAAPRSASSAKTSRRGCARGRGDGRGRGGAGTGRRARRAR